MTHEYSHDNIEGMYERVDIYMRDSIFAGYSAPEIHTYEL